MDERWELLLVGAIFFFGIAVFFFMLAKFAIPYFRQRLERPGKSSDFETTLTLLQGLADELKRSGLATEFRATPVVNTNRRKQMEIIRSEVERLLKSIQRLGMSPPTGGLFSIQNNRTYPESEKTLGNFEHNSPRIESREIRGVINPEPTYGKISPSDPEVRSSQSSYGTEATGNTSTDASQRDFSYTNENNHVAGQTLEVSSQIRAEDEFTQLYNAAASDRSLRNRFWGRYDQYYSIGNSNALSLARGEEVGLDFRTKDAGDLLAFEVPNIDRYLVVPNFDTTVATTTINEGGYGFVFEGTEFDQSQSYSSVRVAKPAQFTRTGDVWTRVEPGRLELRS